MSRRFFGQYGEKLAERFLHEKGFRILERNVRALSFGELDIIARERNALVFVEVKTRQTKSFGTPEEAMTPRKLQRLVRAIHWYLQEHGLSHLSYRLDVIAVDLTGPEPDIRHHRNVGPT